MNKLNGTDFFGEKLTVTLARPLDYRNRAGPARKFAPDIGVGIEMKRKPLTPARRIPTNTYCS
jgi:hypothetical protein